MENIENKAVVVENLSLKIKNETILDNINLELEKGKIHGLIGRNGSGKTMLIKCICGFVKASEGNIYVDGVLIGKQTDFPKKCGIIIETPGFVPYYSGYRNLKILAGLNNGTSKEAVKKAMDDTGISYAAGKLVKTYSLGMRQRLGIAQAIMDDPDILFLDEPMNGLDKEGVEDMRKLFLGLKKQGKTILLVSHNSEDIESLCDDIHEIEKGKIVGEH